ncbi:hypothetical protein GF406_09445 [candidate division KSB1 bacterium]|nr:hypothetical protein [candidate division KSB1 bacterium]
MKTNINWKSGIVMVLLAVTFGSFINTADAQYFGRNRVQYNSFDFQVMKTEHFDIYFYPEKQTVVKEIAVMAERWYARLSKILNHELSSRQPLILYASHPDFQQTNVVRGISEGTGGVTEAFKRRIVMPLAGPLAQTDHVLGHELVHAFQYDMAGVRGPISSASAGMFRLPLWFVEGMAEYLSVGAYDPHTAMWMREAVDGDKFPTISKLNSPRYFPYRYGQALWAFIAANYGDDKVEKIFREASTSGNAEEAIWKWTGIGVDSLSVLWKNSLVELKKSVKKETFKATEYGELLLDDDAKEGSIKLSPSLSPRGDKLLYITTSDLFTIDYYIADVHTGNRKKLTQTLVDPHLQSIQFLYSSGSWTADGEQVIIGVIVNGNPGLHIYDAETTELLKEIAIPSLDEIYSPSWSPDGETVVFTGLDGGVTDLYLFNTTSEELMPLTDDFYADIQPVWSPDGKSIAFATDRFTTDLDSLNFGKYSIAIVNVDSREIKKVEPFQNAKNINPQWALNSKEIYFISDKSGISNIYKVDIETGSLFQITDLFSGVSGMTSQGPALSIAQDTGKIVFSNYENNGFHLYLIDGEKELAGLAAHQDKADKNAGLLSSGNSDNRMVSSLLNDYSIGLKTKDTLRIDEYRSRLSLDYIAPPTIFGGSGQFGTFFYGGTSLLWSDMLGNRNLITSLQISGDLKTIGTQIGYQNVSNRLNWAVILDQTPYVYNRYAGGLVGIDNEPVYIDQELRIKRTSRGIQGIINYPFSAVTRLEMATGFSRYTFSQRLRSVATSAIDGREIFDEETEFSDIDPLNLGRFSLAYVYDNSLSGYTSPILGQRYRIEVSPNYGSLQFTNLLLDYRRYVVPQKPFTLAFRAMHYGQYGRDSQSNILGPVFIGYQPFVRGYDAGSFSRTNPTDFDFNRLLGSKMLVTNVEVRFPLLGLLTGGDSYFGPFPLETAAFVDAGIAYDSLNDPWLLGGNRKPVRSYGLAMRLNVFGFAIVELNYVNPIDRSDRGWMWQFGFSPGF